MTPPPSAAARRLAPIRSAPLAEASAPIPFAPPAISEHDIAAVVDVLRSGWLTTGPVARRFEAAFAAYVGAPHAVAVNSCTAALHLALLAARVGAGDEVITTPLTFCATANTIVHTGATPVLADVDPISLGLDPAAVAAAITPRTRAVVAVHYGGFPVDVATLRSLCDQHGLLLIEDAAHAVETVSNAGKTGSTADFTCFSFYATKNLTTGEGGMLTARSGGRIEWVRMAALHGLSRDAWSRYEPGGRPGYDVVLAGFKYNMPDIQAALGLSQLTRIETALERRVQAWRRYEQGLADLPLDMPAEPCGGARHARHLFTIGVDPARCGLSRDTLAGLLAQRGIGTSVHFGALHLQPFYAARLPYTRGSFPHAERASAQRLSLPFSAAITDVQVDRVVATIRAALKEGGA